VCGSGINGDDNNNDKGMAVVLTMARVQQDDDKE